MPFSKLYSRLNLFLINIALLSLVGCGSFNSSSLVSSDGIYSNESNRENSKSKYYENYFKDKALELENDFVFNDSLISNNEFITSNDINYSTSNPAWGDIPNSVDYVIDYYPYRNRFFGYNYGYGYGGYYGMYPYYGYWNPGYSYYSMRNWYRYGWMSGYYPFYYNFYPYNWFGRTMPFGYRNRYSSYGSYGNSPYDNYLNRDYNNNVSYNKGRRGSASNVVVYGNGTRSSVDKYSKKNKVTNVNVGRSYTKDIDNSNNNVLRIRTYQDFVKSSNSSKPIERNRIYSRPEGGVVKSGSGSSSNTIKDSGRRYYSNPTNSNNQTKSNWGLSGRNYNSSSSNTNNVRSYSNPSSSSQTRSSYNTPTRSSSSSFSRPSSISSSSSSSSSSRSSSGSSRGSR